MINPNRNSALRLVQGRNNTVKRPEQLPCHYCGAKAGEPCIRRDKPHRHPHQDRFTALRTLLLLEAAQAQIRSERLRSQGHVS